MPSIVAENIRRVQDRIAAAASRSGRCAKDVTLIAVTKTATVEQIREAAACGIEHFGENRVQDASVKIPAIERSHKTCWHMIGHLQSNKIHKAAPLFDRIDSLDRWEQAEKLDKSLGAIGKTMDVLVEVKLSQEPNKSGLPPEYLQDMVRRCSELSRIRLRGLMTIAPLDQATQRVRECFRRLKELWDTLNASGTLAQPLDVLSMGMTGDFEIAIEEGSTEARIGRAIFAQEKQP